MKKNIEKIKPLKAIIAIISCLAIALLFELFVANYQFWSTHELRSEQIQATDYEIGTAQNDENGGMKAGNAYSRAVYELDNADAATISVNVGADRTKTQTIGIRIDAEDSGWTRYTYTLDSAKIASGDNEKVTARIEPYGKLKKIVVTAYGTNGSNVTVKNASINEPIPMNFSFERVALLSAALAAISAIRPGSILWRRKHVNSPWILFTFTAAMIAVMSFFFMWHNDDANNTWGTSSCGARDEYAMLARSIIDDGKLSLKQQPPEWLSSMDDLDDGDDRLYNENNIYDPTARDAAMDDEKDRKAVKTLDASDRYKLDVAYYNGEYYVYFGVVPCLIAYIPYHAITGGDLSNTIAIYPALFIIALFSALIIDMLTRRKNPDASAASTCLGLAAIIFASCLCQSVAVPLFYNVPTVFALALLTSGTYLIMHSYCARHVASKIILGFIGALLLAATLGCRPQIAIGAIAVGLSFIALTIRKAMIDKNGSVAAVTIISVIIPVLAVVIGLLWYNNARFGSPLDFGSNYNLTSNDMTLRGKSVERALESLIWYIFGLPHMMTSYPYIDLSFIPELGYGIKTVAESFSGGLLFMAPFIILVAAALLDKRLSNSTRATCGIAIALTTSVRESPWF